MHFARELTVWKRRVYVEIYCFVLSSVVTAHLKITVRTLDYVCLILSI